jgi:protein-disulfide isomerase
MTSRMERAGNIVLLVAVIAIASSSVYRALPSNAASRPASTHAEFYPQWKEEALPLARRIGAAGAPVTVLEFGDLECPACRSFHETIRAVLAERPKDVALLYVHYPLPQHRFAIGAARAAECAQKLGKFAEWVDAVYAKQDSLGLRSWGQFARDAGIADTATIARCATDPSTVQQIQESLDLGGKLQIAGTPTIIVNGWRLAAPPLKSELMREIDSLKAGKSPFTLAHN